MALHQHLAHASHTTEVSVYLERRMGIKQIGVSSTAMLVVRRLATTGLYVGQQFPVDMIGLLGFLQSRLQIDAPTRTPPRRLVTLLYQRLFTGIS